MKGQQRVVIHLVNVIAAQHQRQVGFGIFQKGEVLLDRVGGSGVPVGVGAPFVRLVDLHSARKTAVQVPGPPGPDVLVEGVRAILGEDHHVEDAGVDAVGEGEVNDAILPGEWHGGLGAFGSQHAQARAFSPGQDHGTCFHGGLGNG
jgi:hypothetical protein